MLVIGWLRTSKDAITGTDQQNGCFWGRIHNFFTSHGGGQGRSQTSLSSRFADINKHCAKFSGFYCQIERRSGETQENRVTYFLNISFKFLITFLYLQFLLTHLKIVFLFLDG